MFLTNILPKTIFQTVWKKIEKDFEDIKRAEGQSNNEYVATFDAKYRKVEKKKMTLPSEILAFKLICKANITKEEKSLVLTGMNYDNKGTLDEEAKKYLKKFKGGDSSSSTAIKLKPTCITDNEEAFLAAWYGRGKRGKQGLCDRKESWQRWRPREGDQVVLNFQVQNKETRSKGRIPTDRIRISDQSTK